MENGNLNLTTKAKATKPEINEWDYITPKASAEQTKTIKKMKRQPLKQKKTLANYIYIIQVNIQNIYTHIYKLKQFNSKKEII